MKSLILNYLTGILLKMIFKNLAQIKKKIYRSESDFKNLFLSYSIPYLMNVNRLIRILRSVFN